METQSVNRGYCLRDSRIFCRLPAADMVRWRSRGYNVTNLSTNPVVLILLDARCVNSINATGREVEAANGVVVSG